jgi:hypothetical protein
MVDKTKKDLKMNGWIHMPRDSEKYQYYGKLCGHYETFGYEALGVIFQLDRSVEGFKIAVKHYNKARAICNLLGMKDEAKEFESKIVVATELQASSDPNISLSTGASYMLQIMKNKYKQNLDTTGMSSESTIRSGLNYASALRNMHHCIDIFWLQHICFAV